MNELYKNNKYPTSTAEQNNAILRRLEQDVAVLGEEVRQIKDVLSFIQNVKIISGSIN